MNGARHVPSLPLLSSPHSHLSTASPDSLLSALRTPHSSRSPRELQLLQDLLASLPFSQSFTRSSEILALCAANIRVEYIDKSEFLFHTGEISAKCYVVLKGAVKLQEAKESVTVGGCLGGQDLVGTAWWPDTAVTEEDCELAVLRKKDIKGVVEALEARKKADFVDILRLIPAFDGLRTRTLRTLASALETREYHRGQYVFRSGDISNEIFIVKEGKFRLTQSFAPSPTLPASPFSSKVLRRRAEVATLGAGSCLGSIEALQGKRRLQNCECKSEIGVMLVLGKRVRTLSGLFEGETERRQFGSRIKAKRENEAAFGRDFIKN